MNVSCLFISNDSSVRSLSIWALAIALGLRVGLALDSTDDSPGRYADISLCFPIKCMPSVWVCVCVCLCLAGRIRNMCNVLLV